jgi:hypothetical protein
MDQHRVPSPHLDALTAGGPLEVTGGDRHAGVEAPGSAESGHVEHDPAADPGPHVLDAELRQPGGGEDLRVVQAVVVTAVDTGVAEAVKMAAHVVRGDDMLGERRQAVVAGLARDAFQGLVREDDLMMDPRLDNGHIRGSHLGQFDDVAGTRKPQRGQRRRGRELVAGADPVSSPVDRRPPVILPLTARLSAIHAASTST